MPSINDAIVSKLDLTGYEPVPSSPAPPNPAPSFDGQQTGGLEPGRNTMIRCPLPPLWQASPDSLRQFYVKGQVPQMRVMLPSAPGPVGGSTSTTTAVISSSSGSSGGGGSSGVSIAAAQAVVRTPVLFPGNKFTGTIALPKSFQLLSLAVGSPCRIQLYGSALAQSQDSSRALDAAPAAGTTQNIICDVALDTAPYQWAFQNRIGANTESPQTATIYVTLTNLDATSDAITLTVQYVPLES